MGVCTKRSTLLASDRTNSSSSRSPSAATRQLTDLDFSVLADPSVDWNPACPDILDLASCGECYNLCHSDTLVESQSAGSFAGLLLEVSNYRYKDLYLYGSFELMCYFLSRRWYVAWCAKIDHLVLTLPHRLLHMLYRRSSTILCLICSSILSLFR